MFCVHISCVALESIRFLFTEFKKDYVLIPQILDIFQVVLYQGAIFYAQIVYVNLDKSNRVNQTQDDLEESNLAENWILVELITYYAQIVQAVIFLLYSSLYKPVKPTRQMRKLLSRKREHDYLTST
jgi:NADH:ubiquinone oxidoreductase subunit 6 (subunit J)